MSLKFENIANVGDRIRAYHFHERTDCYVEGVVLEKTTHPYEGFECFVITVDVDCWKRWIYPKVDVRKVYACMATGTGVARGHKRLDALPDDQLLTLQELKARPDAEEVMHGMSSIIYGRTISPGNVPGMLATFAPTRRRSIR